MKTMKKFLIVVIICIVTASLGLLTYNFMSTKEKIMIDDVIYYVNIGEDFTVNYERVNPKSSTKIELSYDGFSDIIQESRTKENTFAAIGAGKAVMKLSTNISGFTPVTITVYVGDGSTVAPHYIDSAYELSKVGTGEGYVKGDGYFKADASYVLTQDIDLENVSFEPLCNTAEGFTGKFNFADYSISNLLINSSDIDNAGLFAKIGKDGQIVRASLKNVSVDGSYANVGAIAGINEGKISHANVVSLNLNDTKENANVGGIAGLSTGNIYTSSVVGLTNESLVAGVSGSNAGGIVGRLETLNSAIVNEINKCYVQNVKVSGQYAGGLVGSTLASEVRDVYVRNATVEANGNNAYAGGMIGQMEYSNNITLGSSLLNGYVAENHLVGTNADVFVGNTVNYSGASLSDKDALKVENIMIGLYNIGDGNTKYPQSTYVYTAKIDNVSNITVSTFITKTNVKEQEDDSSELRNIGFNTDAWIINDGAYPVLNMDGIDTTSNILRTGNAGFVDNANSIKDSISNSEVSKIILKSDIDGSNSHLDSLGELNKEFDGAGHTIKNYRLDGPMFSRIASTIKNVTFENIIVTSNGNSLAILTAINEGTISNVRFVNCKVVAEQNINEEELNIGIVASTNSKNIQNVALKSNTINLGATRNGNVNVGFVAGRNNENIKNVLVYSNNKMSIESNINNTTYAGGVAGDNNNGSIEYASVGYGCDINGENATSAEKAMIVAPCTLDVLTIGGVAGYNQGTVRYNEISGTYYGYRFGGIIGENNVQNSAYYVEENNVTENTFAEAVDLGGLVAIENYGLISNCSTFATLNGYNENSRVGGICVELHNSQAVQNCFVSTSFTGEGEKHYGVGTNGHIHTMDDKVSNVIINTKNMGGALSNNYNETGSFWGNFGGWVSNIFNHYELEIRLSDEECQNLTTYTKYNFNQDIWILGNEYPRLQKIANASDSLNTIISGLVF